MNRLSGFMSEYFFKPIYEIVQGNTKRHADFTDLQEIKPTFARFIFADKGLRLSKEPREFRLPNTGGEANLAKKFLELGLIWVMHALLHGGRIEAWLTDQPKSG